ncbi:MAG: alanine racemase [Lachnospiraceae bacterium]|nr:alanine racemase [Lachnospiraceae bacterium]
MKKYSRVYAKIDLDAVEANFRSMRANIKEGTRMVAVVKTDAYGHGAVQIARLAENYDYIWGFAVAAVEEAVLLRRSGIRKPILILGYTFEEDYPTLIREKIRPAVFQLETARKLSRAAEEIGESLAVHLALDTGMTRIGFKDNEASAAEIKEIQKLPGLVIEGMFTHFARADEKEKKYAREQLRRYCEFADRLEQEGVPIPMKHCSNSAGILELPDANLDAVRAGITIYGIYPSEEMDRVHFKLQPVMEWKSHITFIKEVEANVPVSYGGTFVTDRPMRIATIPVGYGDGYPRSLSNKGWVLIHGKKARILGRVCMDQFMVDVTGIEAEEQDEVTLMGRDGAQELSVDTLGALSGRFPYEFVCDIGKRVPRVYIRNGKAVEASDLLQPGGKPACTDGCGGC